MKQYGYVNGQRVQLDNEPVEIVIERYADDAMIRQGWGGRTLVRVLTYQDGKRVVGFFSARISGDARAGSQNGVHLGVTATNKNRDNEKEVHAVPWYKADD